MIWYIELNYISNMFLKLNVLLRIAADILRRLERKICMNFIWLTNTLTHFLFSITLTYFVFHLERKYQEVEPRKRLLGSIRVSRNEWEWLNRLLCTLPGYKIGVVYPYYILWVEKQFYFVERGFQGFLGI